MKDVLEKAIRVQCTASAISYEEDAHGLTFASVWRPDASASACENCGSPFSMFGSRRHRKFGNCDAYALTVFSRCLNSVRSLSVVAVESLLSCMSGRFAR